MGEHSSESRRNAVFKAKLKKDAPPRRRTSHQIVIVITQSRSDSDRTSATPVPSGTAADVTALKKAGAIAGKYYPEGVTTNAEDGIKSTDELYPILEVMEEENIVLCIHGEEPTAPVLEREREEARRELLASLAPGQLREGVVRKLTEFGAFVDLGGVDGLLHVSELGWGRVHHPSEVLEEGLRGDQDAGVATRRERRLLAEEDPLARGPVPPTCEAAPAVEEEHPGVVRLEGDHRHAGPPRPVEGDHLSQVQVAIHVAVVDEEGLALASNMEVSDEKLKLPSAIWMRYVYVEEKPDPFRESLPAVVLGLDYVAVKGEYLFTFTLLASEANFEQAEEGFRAFVQDAGFGG